MGHVGDTRVIALLVMLCRDNEEKMFIFSSSGHILVRFGMRLRNKLILSTCGIGIMWLSIFCFYCSHHDLKEFRLIPYLVN